MASEKNITMRQYNGVDYDTLYPKTKVEQVEGAYTQQQILADSTKGWYGLGSDAVPDDLFQIIGNMLAVIHVIAPAGATITMSKGEKTVTVTADSNGFADLHPSEYGEWAVTCNDTTKTIIIDKASVYYMVIPNLHALSWSQISYVSKNGLASTLFHIGDEKTLTVNGVSYTAVIIGFDHDTPVNTATYGRDKAGITWQLKNCLNTTYSMNSSDTNSGGWKSCAMRTSTMATLLGQLASDLKNAIVKVKKLSSAGDLSTAINTTEDSLFLLSEVEIFGSTTNSKSGEGSQYAYYKAGNSKVKKVNGFNNGWWERSPYGSDSISFCYVNRTGGAFYFSASATDSGGEGVSFGFCV